jgi:TRAP-type C4-dicarboxylate transport system permease small subunit
MWIFSKIKDGKLDAWLGAAFVVVMVVNTVVSVFMRYVLDAPLQWVEELAIAVFIWTIMIGMVSAMKARMHISIDVLTMLLPEKAQRVSRICNDLVSAATLVVMGTLGLHLAFESGGKIMPLLGIPYLYIDIAVPVGAYWTALYLIVGVVAELSGRATGPVGGR